MRIWAPEASFFFFPSHSPSKEAFANGLARHLQALVKKLPNKWSLMGQVLQYQYLFSLPPKKESTSFWKALRKISAPNVLISFHTFSHWVYTTPYTYPYAHTVENISLLHLTAEENKVQKGQCICWRSDSWNNTGFTLFDFKTFQLNNTAFQVNYHHQSIDFKVVGGMETWDESSSATPYLCDWDKCLKLSNTEDLVSNRYKISLLKGSEDWVRVSIKAFNTMCSS